MSEDHTDDVLSPIVDGEAGPATAIEPDPPVASETEPAVELADSADPLPESPPATGPSAAESSSAESNTLEPGPGERRSLSEPQRRQRRAAARQSTGPRSAPGKSRSRMNAIQHGLSAHFTFFWESMAALGEDPEDFKQLLTGLIDSLHPVGTTELALTSDVASLMWKKARLERAQHGVWDRHQELLELEHRRAAADMDSTSVDTTHEAILANGLRGVPDSIAKYEETLSVLKLLDNRVKQKDYQEEVTHTVRLLYGEHLTWRGGQIEEFFGRLQQAAQRGVWDEAETSVHRSLKLALNEEMRDVIERYQIFFQEKVEVTRAQRHAVLAPEGPQWALMIRMENSLHRHIERKLRLLLEMQRERRKLEEPPDENPSPSRTPPAKTPPRRFTGGSPSSGSSSDGFGLDTATTGSTGVNFGFADAAPALHSGVGLKGASPYPCHAQASFSRLDFHSLRAMAPVAPASQPAFSTTANRPATGKAGSGKPAFTGGNVDPRRCGGDEEGREAENARIVIAAKAGIRAGAIPEACLSRQHGQKMFFNKTNRRSCSKQSSESGSFCRKSPDSEPLRGVPKRANGVSESLPEHHRRARDMVSAVGPSPPPPHTAYFP